MEGSLRQTCRWGPLLCDRQRVQCAGWETRVLPAQPLQLTEDPAGVINASL